MSRSLRQLTWVELKLFFREPMTVVFTLALPPIILYVLNGVFGNDADPEFYGGAGPVDWYTPAYVGLVLVAVGVLSLPTHLASYRESGVLRRFEASGLPPLALTGAHLAVTMAIGALGALVLTTMSVAAYDAALPTSWPLTLAAFALSAAMFAAIGTLLGTLLPTARAAQGAGLLLFFLMQMLSGPGPPPEVLPAGLLTVSDLLPLTHAAELLRAAWLEGAWDVGPSLVVVGILALAVPATALLIARDRRR